MKTIKQWLEELPEPYRSQAFANVKKLSPEPNIVFSDNAESMFYAVLGAFVWGYSSEGSSYWREMLEDRPMASSSLSLGNDRHHLTQKPKVDWNIMAPVPDNYWPDAFNKLTSSHPSACTPPSDEQ